MPLDPKLQSKLEALEVQAEELSRSLADPEVTSDMDRYTQLSRSYAECEPILAKFREYLKVDARAAGCALFVECARRILGMHWMCS